MRSQNEEYIKQHNIDQRAIDQLKLKPFQDVEYRAWRDMCEKIQSIFNITDKEFNDRPDIKELMILVSHWGYEFAVLREITEPIHHDMKPIFYKESK